MISKLDFSEDLTPGRKVSCSISLIIDLIGLVKWNVFINWQWVYNGSLNCNLQLKRKMKKQCIYLIRKGTYNSMKSLNSWQKTLIINALSCGKIVIFIRVKFNIKYSWFLFIFNLVYLLLEFIWLEMQCSSLLM